MPALRSSVSWGAVAVGLVVALSSCKAFDPPIQSGTLACGARGSCPPGFQCGPQGTCCAPGDRTGACGSPRSVGGSGGAGGSPPSSDAGGSDAATVANLDAAVGPEPDGPAPVGDAGAEAEPAGGPARLVAGPWKLIGSNGCVDLPADVVADRWCAFYNGIELWVLDVTRALSTPVVCDGTDPSCLRLSGNAFRADATKADWASRFEGDLLIYQTEPNQALNENFRGVIAAWRPGWPEGRRLTNLRATDCSSNRSDHGTVACYEDLDDIHMDLRGGRLPQERDVGLPRITGGDADVAWVEPTSGGDALVYSAATTIGGAAKTFVVPAGQVADPGAHKLLLEGATMQGLSPDGRRAYALTGSAGSLVRIELPTGTNPAAGKNFVEMARGIAGVVVPTGVAGDKGILLAYGDWDDRIEGDAWIFPDPGAPTKSFPLGRTEVDEMVISDDGAYVYLDATDPKTLQLQGRVYDVKARTSCALGPAVEPPRRLDAAVRFSKDSRWVFWEKPAVAGTPMPTLTTWMARAADCQSPRLLGSRAGLPLALPSGRLIVRQEGAGPLGGPLETLAPVSTALTTAAGADRIFDATDRAFAVITAGTSATVVFTSSAPGREGIYLAQVPP